ncbi:tetratricopeptide repeat protein [Helicobacter saguini]|uniref:Tetratricopeptide repeat protein n=1 Tax=Helicobacter saguini TaxID=1548018 RepID=A0A347VVQ4_9HELI|nr:tetratricopeptide repeat protein [Helicobacter saguini]MWV62332.1 tetratricopeptide repeat protein [Helicobacter saguini]MWV66997.1 tetratricopeptide repeat protein [Helicobacter saguini]MWV69345.1 tetratricopeptide repeat protein [Helicobacter saguini]MWV71100.1 tetratricopeptide repeat protein [Helicobacter saguini]TLD95004.1 tetratricopeptide repeat protein [Helicobacter saguini]
MNNFFNFVEIYRNPIFGILALVLIILLIAFLDSIKKTHTKKRRKEALNNISKNFENIDLNENIKNFIDYTDNPVPPLMLIADTYAKVGNNEQAIAIYRTLNEYIKNTKEKIQILESLGECYYKAGFLERSKEIFTEILRNYPHNVTILYNYIYTCENLKQYNEALDALNCIEELYNENPNFENKKNSIYHNKNYLKTMIIINNHKIKLVEQQEKLLEMYDLDSTLHGLILRHFRIYNTGLFWQKILEKKNIKPYIDVLWQFQKHEIPFEFIAKDSNLLNIYRAKGYIKEYVEIDNFALESLQLLNLYSHIKGDLEFIYNCSACGGNSPFYAYRCHICNEINTIKLHIRPTQHIKSEM